MNALVFPSVAEVRLKRIKDNESALVDQAQSLGWFCVMLMDLRNAIRKIKLLMIDRMIEWYLNELKFREDFFLIQAG